MTAGSRLRSATRGFYPLSLANLARWYRVGSLVLVNNDPVATWPDSSSNAAHATQATSGKRPLYKTGMFGPWAVLDGVYRITEGVPVFHTMHAPTATELHPYSFVSSSPHEVLPRPLGGIGNHPRPNRIQHDIAGQFE